MSLASIFGVLSTTSSPEHSKIFSLMWNACLYAAAPGRFILCMAVIFYLGFFYDEWELSATDMFLFLFVIFFIPMFLLGKIFRSAVAMLTFLVFMWYGPSSDFLGYYTYHSVNGLKTMWHKKNGHDPYEIVPGPEFRWISDWKLEIPETPIKVYGGIGYVDPLEYERQLRAVAQHLRFVYPDDGGYYKQFVIGELSIIHKGETVSIFQMCNSEERRLNRPACQGTGGAKLLAETTPLKYFVALHEVAQKLNIKLSRWEHVKF